MANFGKRMVAEDLIKQIGQTGPEYDNGYGIIFTEESDGTISIGVDTVDIAQVTDLAYLEPKMKEFSYIEDGYQQGVDAWYAKIPFLKTNDFTDTDQDDPYHYTDAAGNKHDVITLDPDDLSHFVAMQGTFALRKTSSNTNYLVTTSKSNITTLIGTTGSGVTGFNKMLVQRTGNNDISFWYARTNELGTATIYAGTANEMTVNVFRVTRHTYNQINTFRSSINSGGMLGTNIRIDNLKPNVSVTSTPTTAGTYTLQCTVDADGGVSEVKWVAVE